MNIYAYIQLNYYEEPCSSEQWLGAVKLPAGLLLSPRALPYPAGCSGGGMSANAVGNASGFGSGRSGSLLEGFS